jgi:hypothetical protein
MATLTPLDSTHGYYAGVNSLDTSGYVAVIPAFQQVFFADGRLEENHGYNKLNMFCTKIEAQASGAFQVGETVKQAVSGATGIYIECTDIKIPGTPSAPFTIGELVTQASSNAKGFVVSSQDDSINIIPITQLIQPTVTVPPTYPYAFNSTNQITGSVSGATITPSSTISAWQVWNIPPVAPFGSVGRFHFIYRTTTTEFDSTHTITGSFTAKTLTPFAERQILIPNATATGGTFTITYDGQTTSAIEYNASTGAIQTALEHLSNIENGGVEVGGHIFSNGTSGLTLTFLAALGDVALVTVTSSMTAATSVAVTERLRGGMTVQAPPHWLPWTPASGVFPEGGSNIGCLCFGRIFLNSMNSPFKWACSRKGFPETWNFGELDVGAAAQSSLERAGDIGEPIIVTIPYKDNYLIIGCTNSVWLLTSDPKAGATLRNISKTTGIFSPNSYCWDDNGNLYFVGSDAIYALGTEAVINAQAPVNVTKDRVPLLISSLQLNRRTDRIAMEYDKKGYGLLVSVTQQDGQWATSWWIDLRTGGVFPMQFQQGHDAASMHYLDAYDDASRVLLLGGYDGYIRTEDSAAKNDTNADDTETAIASRVALGPIVAEGEPREKVGITETSLVLGDSSDGVTIEYHTADSADTVVNNVLIQEAPFLSKTLTGAGLKSSVIDRVSGRAVAIVLSNDTIDSSFSVESITVNLGNEGRKKG